MEYDVFISCKSEDYYLAKEVHHYLINHNYSVFLADTELKRNAEYGEIIDDALDSAKHLIIIASNPRYVISTYVKSEWRTFIEEKRSGRKVGNIITIVNFSIDLLPIGLRHFQSFALKSYESIVDFLPTDILRKENVLKKIYFQSNEGEFLNEEQKLYEDFDNDILHALSKKEDKKANIELGKRYFGGCKGKFKSESMAKYYWNKAGVMIEDYLGLQKVGADVSNLGNDALLDLCKVNDLQACIEMGMRYYRGYKGKCKSPTMAKYYWDKVGYSLEH